MLFEFFAQRRQTSEQRPPDREPWRYQGQARCRADLNGVPFFRWQRIKNRGLSETRPQLLAAAGSGQNAEPRNGSCYQVFQFRRVCRSRNSAVFAGWLIKRRRLRDDREPTVWKAIVPAV